MNIMGNHQIWRLSTISGSERPYQRALNRVGIKIRDREEAGTTIDGNIEFPNRKG